ncbi:MAG: RdgB/HAM1 family non-canonical purine NTP pyrophosphatase [Bacillota bacterium]|nr:RdgB/HAM1 family non-canonical purine NTP pyrophosphatase [Bacillota bacterium]
MRFILASNNAHKISEIRAILSPLGASLLSLKDAGIDSFPDETGTTFEENAIIKAEAVFKKTGIPAIADDSGLEVRALGGAPGVHSARYCEGTDLDRIKKLLNALSGVPEGERNARFVSVIACVRTEGSFTARGVCEGEILSEIKGMGGFGYDPVFFVPEENMTFAEMPPEIKNRISHRAKALSEFKKKLIKG